MTYYSDERITYQEAEDEVQKYVVEKEETRTFVTAADICRSRGIEPSQHNQHRIHRALSEQFERVERWSKHSQKFRIER